MANSKRRIDFPEVRKCLSCNRRVVIPCILCMPSIDPAMNHTESPDRVTYLPSQQEIREKCKEIRAGWSEEERASRVVAPGSGDITEFVKPWHLDS